MRITLKRYLQSKFRGRSSFDAIGLACTADQVLLCGMKQTNDGLLWQLDESFSHKNLQHDLSLYVEQNSLQGTPCVFTLSSHWYRLLQLDKPDVAEEEVYQALKWSIDEQLGAALPLVYDYVDMPLQIAGQNKVTAVAIAKEEVQKFSQIIFSADLDLKTISVEEFASAQLVNDEDAVITLVQEFGEVVVLNIVKDNQVFLSRRLNGFENIGSFSQQELEMGITDSLCVQLQRSIDFFESQLRQAPIKKILVKLDSPETEFLCEKVSEAMGVDCSILKPPITCADDLNFQMASFSCLGGAYSLVRQSHASNKWNDKGQVNPVESRGVVHEN